jgi:hypothetical protein
MPAALGAIHRLLVGLDPHTVFHPLAHVLADSVYATT